MTRRTEPLSERVPKPRIEIHPHDANPQHIENGDPVNVTTARGSVSTVARVTDTIEKGVVFVPFHFPGINALTLDALDADAKIPEYKVAACRVEKGGQQ